MGSTELNIRANITNKAIIEENEQACWMYRKQPTNEVDSGRRIFRGSESEAYLEDSSNFIPINALNIITLDDSIKVNPLAAFGSSFERDADGSWEPVAMEVLGAPRLKLPFL